MLCITHASIGGAVGSFVTNPSLAFILGIVSHLIIDKIPHFWPFEKCGKTTVMILDAVGSSIILLFLLNNFGFNSPIFWGAVGGVTVDVVLVLVAGLYKPLYNSKIRTWHEKRQPHKTNFVYLFTDLIQTIIGLMIIFLVK